MTTNFYNLLTTLFRSVWQLMTGFYIPGTNVTPGGLFLFLASAFIGLKFVKRIFGSGVDYVSERMK